MLIVSDALRLLFRQQETQPPKPKLQYQLPLKWLSEQDRPLVYMEDVGRHNAVDKIAGWMMRNDVSGGDKILYTTGRLTSEMVIKTAQMGIPVLTSRSGFTAWGVEIAEQVGMTLIGRMKGKRFQCLSGSERLDFDADLTTVQDDPKSAGRKGAEHG